MSGAGAQKQHCRNKVLYSQGSSGHTDMKKDWTHFKVAVLSQRSGGQGIVSYRIQAVSVTTVIPLRCGWGHGVIDP